MNKTEEDITRTLDQENFLHALREICHMEGFTPQDISDFIKKDNYLAEIYQKQPHRLRRSKDERPGDDTRNYIFN